MDLKGIVSASGKPGLYKLIGQNKAGFILESLDEHKIKSVVNLSQTKMATLEDITIYGEAEDIQLTDIFSAMQEKGDCPDPKKADSDQLKTYFKAVAPEHDTYRVYVSDIKKILAWFQILQPLGLLEKAQNEAAEKEEQA